MAQYLLEFDGNKYIICSSGVQEAKDMFLAALEAEGILKIYKIESDKYEKRFVMIQGEKHEIPPIRVKQITYTPTKPITGVVEIENDNFEDGTILTEQTPKKTVVPIRHKKIIIHDLLSQRDTGFTYSNPNLEYKLRQEKKENKNVDDNENQ